MYFLFFFYLGVVGEYFHNASTFSRQFYLSYELHGIKELLRTDDTPDNYLNALCISLPSV